MIEHRRAVQLARKKNRELPRVSEYIGECIIRIAENLAHRPSFAQYTFHDEMISDAIENCFIYIDNFDPAKSKYPFGYFTQISYYAFVRRIQKEARQQGMKHKFVLASNIDDIIRQAHDSGEGEEPFVSYLMGLTDIAEKAVEKSAEEKKTTVQKRRPKYMDK